MITLNNNNLEITEGNTTPNSGKMLSSPSVTPEMDDNMKIKFTKIDVNSYKGFIKGELVVAEQGNELNTALVLYGWDEVGLYNHEFINPVYGFIEGGK